MNLFNIAAKAAGLLYALKILYRATWLQCSYG